MLSPGEIEKIKAEIERLEKACDRCADTGIRNARGLDRGAKTEVGVGQESKLARHQTRMGNSRMPHNCAGTVLRASFQSLLTTCRFRGPGQRSRKSNTVQN